MKRCICVLTTLLLMLTLYACSWQEEPELIDPVPFYYLRTQNADELYHGSADSVIAPEDWEANGIRHDIDTLLTLYFSGPKSEGLESPFPKGVKLVSWERNGDTLSITLTDTLAELADMDLTLACACLSLTCFELTDANAVQIRAESVDLSGKTSITMDRMNLVLTDDGYLTTEPKES